MLAIAGQVCVNVKNAHVCAHTRVFVLRLMAACWSMVWCFVRVNCLPCPPQTLTAHRHRPQILLFYLVSLFD